MKTSFKGANNKTVNVKVVHDSFNEKYIALVEIKNQWLEMGSSNSVSEALEEAEVQWNYSQNILGETE